MKRILISRTDSIGDVVLTLPIAGVLKKIDKNFKITFLARNYTKAIVEISEFVDEFLSWEELEKLSEKEQIKTLQNSGIETIIHVFPNKHIAKIAKKAQIKTRIGTSHRIYHLNTCNKLVNLGRKNSDLHEAQLNLKMIKCLGANNLYQLKEIQKFYGFTKIKPLPSKFQNMIAENKFNLILHPKSKGSAREWGIENFAKLIELLPNDRFKLFISGTEAEGNSVRKELIEKYKYVTDITGKMNLDEFISFIAQANGLLAASTGPLHIAAALGKYAFGLFAPMRPIFPKRWSPIGKNAQYFVLNKKCNDCRKNLDCHCIKDLNPELIKQEIEKANVLN